MTTHYRTKYTRASDFASIRVLCRWNGSVYKLVWPHLLLFMLLYFTISYFYRLTFTKTQKSLFVEICKHFAKYLSNIPLSFMLGFYTSILIERWWYQAKNLPWPDEVTLLTNVHVQGKDDRGKLMRRNIVRYLNLSYIISFTLVSIPVKSRFPTVEHFVQAGLMFPHEKKIFDHFHMQFPRVNINWIPIMWCKSLLVRARRENRISSDLEVAHLFESLMTYRSSMGGLIAYDWINVPLVYSQVVAIATYAFFCFTLVGRQFIQQTHQNYSNHTVVDKYTFSSDNVDFYFPFFLFFEFFFFIGWLKVGETLLNPFGEDDDDFDINWLIDRNFQVTNLMVDEFHDYIPDLEQDIFWNEAANELPYNLATLKYKIRPYLGSTSRIKVDESQAHFLPIEEKPKPKNWRKKTTPQTKFF